MLFISSAYAQEATVAGAPDLISNIIPLVAIFAVFYFLLIRPQHKKMKAHETMVAALKRGAEVVTAGGLLGKVVKADDATGILDVEISKDVIVRVKRSTVLEVSEKPAKKNSDEKKGKTKKNAKKNK